MSDPVQDFEFMLKKNSTKPPLRIYSNNKQQNKHHYKPQDVITSVSLQLKAIQVADTLKSKNYVVKDLQKYKNSNFLSVNNLPVYEEVPKPTTKFDTQCVSDTQLINIIEDAEIIDVHRGMTQEFETSFIHYTEKHLVDDEKTNAIHINDNISDKESMDKIHNKNTDAISDSLVNNVENNTGMDTSLSIISPIMCSNKKGDGETAVNTLESKKEEPEEFTQVLNECIEIDDDTDVLIERPLSPIFMNKNVKTKSKTPSPLVFNLDRFERFEKIAIPILEANDMKTAKQVINSQILDKELHIQMDEEIILNKREILSPVLQNKFEKEAQCDDRTEFKTHIDKDPDLDTDLEFIELDKATSDNLITKIMNEDSNNLQNRAESEILKDEILFSSDEEDYEHKSYQDLPFTCALETSFYNQSDVLDKTMYVGFQTASNKSIQVFTESFSQAKSILSEEITVTDLVKNCDSNVKNKTQDVKEDQVNMDLDDEEKEFNSGRKDEDGGGSELKPNNKNTIEELKDILPTDSIKTPENNNFEGFMTASKKVIKLSQKALARCKKVFQDIDLNESFDTQPEKPITENDIESHEDEIPVVTNIFNKDVIKNAADDDIQSIDDVIIQEFENIEMSFKEDEETDKDVPNIGFKTASNKKIQISDAALTKIKDVFKDIDFEEDLNELDIRKTNTGENALPKMMEIPKLSENDNDINLRGFKTASNKNINISKEALAKTKNLFQDIDSIELPIKSNKSLDKVSQKIIDFEKPSTSKAFIGFKTANNKNIKISEQAIAKTKTIFKDIDTIELPKKNKIPENPSEEIINDQTSFSRMSFVGFKKANNKDINISKDALAKTKNIFEGIDSADLKLPTKKTKGWPHENVCKEFEGFLDFNQPSTSKSSLLGFKTANNKDIKISDAALTKTRNVFKDIDSSDFKFPEKGKNIEDEMHDDAETLGTLSTNPKTSFLGFKTANNKNITISKDSLVKTKNIFKDIDASDFEFPDKVNKDVEKVDFIENKNKRDDYSPYRAKSIDLNQPSNSNAGFLGFKTANNKKINISEESLAKTKDLFKDIDSNDFVYPKKPDKHMLETENQDKATYQDLKESVQPSTSKDSFIGFKTGNNKVINVSETALTKTRNIFKNIDATKFELPDKVKEDYPNIDIDDVEANLISKDRIMTRNNVCKIPQYKFQGFQTASNKKVKVSADALFKSRKIFQDIDVSQDFDLVSKVIKDKNVLDTVKDSLYIRNEIDENTEVHSKDEEGLNDKSNPVFKGFQTCNKKAVTISEEALARSRKLFQDIETIKHDPELEFHGFKTAIDEDVSKKVFIETEKLFADDIKGRNSFKGFQTASDKKVSISKDSLVKSKKMFENIDNNDKKTSKIQFGFKTGTNRDIVISEEAIVRSKRLFSDIDSENITTNKKDKINEENIANIIDTQVLNNFDESLHTEDFHETPKNSKRSGSPILSCPKAKKRKKFETPYSQKPKREIKKEITIAKDMNKVIFTENYKANKKYTLNDLAKLSKNNSNKIDKYLLNLTFDNLLQFEFHEHRNGLTNGKITIDSLKELFLNSVYRKLIPDGWLDNHLKLILWKLISYEIKFNSSVVCSAKNVIDQLKYRYDKELYNAHRPALRKILEKDDVASKTIVLCVAGMYVDGVGVASSTTVNNLELLLTDGWYCIKASIDKMLAQLVCQGKIVVGTKIVTNGAELVNCEQGISPWEDTSAVRLKLFANSTRRARWDARLGYHGNGAILSQLSSVKLDGGKVSKLRVFVTRVYPALYVEKFEDGSTVTRSERLEHLHQMKSEAERQAIMEKIYEEVEKEFSDQELQDSESLSELGNKRTCLDSGSQIAKVMKRSKDPGEFRAGLTTSQSRLLEAHNSKKREVLLQDIEKKIRDKIEKAGVHVNRNVVTLLKIRVAGVIERDGVEISKGMMSIWKPTDAVLEIIKEGTWIDVMNVVPTAVRYSEIQISAGRQSVFGTSKYKEPEKFKPYTNILKRSCFTIKDLTQNPSMTTDYNEIDTVGFIFLIDPSIQEFDSTKQPFQNVFLADADKNIICVSFWGGLKKFGFQNVLDTGQVVACTNLQKRAGNTRKSIPQYRVTEFSHFTKTPKNENARNLLDDLSKTFISLDRRKFCEDCVVLKNNNAIIKVNNENISPYRFNNTDFNSSKNKMFIDSPLARPKKIDDNFNLTGLDFESTFRQTDTQNLPEEVLLRKKKVNEKIARLKMYGEPPPLSTIHIINRSKNASNSYKSPLNSNNNNSKIITQQKSKSESSKLSKKSDSSMNVASVKESPEMCGNLNDSDLCSPVLMNRTYVKGVNPVKINFDVRDNNDSTVDYFAEDFDGSPPLSLD